MDAALLVPLSVTAVPPAYVLLATLPNPTSLLLNVPVIRFLFASVFTIYDAVPLLKFKLVV